jgi:hypothetical protein
MNSGLIAGIAAVSGSIVGAFGSVVGTWITTRHQDLRDLLAKQIVRREALYSDFITERRGCWSTRWRTIRAIL